MNERQDIVQLIRDNGGIIRAGDAVEKGFSYEYLRRALRRGEITQWDRGFYTLPDFLDDDMFLLQARYSRGIYSHTTALYLHELSDRTPLIYDMTFPARYNAHRIEKQLVRSRFDSPKFYGKYRETVKNLFEREITVYSAERTLCDILRSNAKVDSSLVSDAYKRWATRPEKNILAITECARLLGVADKVRSYLEVLL